MHMTWEDGFEIRLAARDGAATLSANREGLLSLARILCALAEGQPGDHVHLDEHNALEDGSAELVIERLP
jgi:hypothetical protein